MSATVNTDAVCDKINNEVQRLLRAESFQEWLEQAPARADDLIVFNNSFLYREGSNKTAKNTKYLCVRVDQGGLPELPVSISQPGRVNTQFKRIAARTAEKTLIDELRPHVEYELARLGMMVRALIGRIGEDEPATIRLEGVDEWKTLQYEPSQANVVELSGDRVSTNRVDDLDVVWKAFTTALEAIGIDIPDQLPQTFEHAFADLREIAYRPVDVHDVGAQVPSILSEVTKHLDRQIAIYGRALKHHLADPNDSESLNDILRVAYNFADGTQELMGLAIGICDMKPVVFWLTICDQFLLADQFSKLPFSIIGRGKPSLSQYRQIISGARNRAFHDVFAFGQPFRARLTGDAFRAPELRLFRQYTSKVPVLDYEDRDLVTLLEGFTRPVEKPVPIGFWETNLQVMKAVADVSRALHRGLLLATEEQ